MTEPKIIYKYGMLERPFSPGCQPMYGLIGCEEPKGLSGDYWPVLYYDRPLTVTEIADCELEFIGKETV